VVSVEGQHKDDHCVLNSAVCDVINLDLQRDNLNDSVVNDSSLSIKRTKLLNYRAYVNSDTSSQVEQDCVRLEMCIIAM